MNKLLSSLSCTWMIILDCLFYVFDSLSQDISLEDIANLVVAWLNYIASCDITPSDWLIEKRPRSGVICESMVQFN